MHLTSHFTVSLEFLVSSMDVPFFTNPLDVPGHFIPGDKINIWYIFYSHSYFL